jgi:1-acyl-sn-glycerol-3-phosphate acyltransferase
MAEPTDTALREAITHNRKIVFPLKESNKRRIAGKLRYWWCWLAASFMLLFIAAPTLIFLWLIDRRVWLYPLANWGAGAWLTACGAGIVVSGLDNINPDRSYIFIANHRSYLDTAALFRYTGKRMGLVAKKELLKVPVLGQGMNFVNIIAIDRTNPERARASLELARTVLRNGYSFGIFAEGTRAMPGELLPFKKGAFHLAVQTGEDIVPVAIKNTDRMMGKNTGVAFPGTIEMVILPPITVHADADVDELLASTRGAIARELASSPAAELVK